MAVACKELQTAVSDTRTGEDQLRLILQRWRAAHEKANPELADTQNDLIKLLTLRQEAVLLTLGLLK